MTDSVQVLSKTHHHYPLLLQEISSVPDPLYARGSSSCLNARLPVAIVGTRKMSHYGQRVLYDLIPRLVQQGATIVSGLAYGVDALAHKIALEHGGRCVAVLASGVDLISPAGNSSIAKNILASGGAIVSERPPGTVPLKQYFPARNRIISGMCKASIVIEAGERSGALITAQFALEQNREVFAVPGSVFSEQSKGTNRIIAEGAIPLLSVENLLEHLSIEAEAHPSLPLELQFENEDEKSLYEILKETQTVDELLDQFNGNPSELNQLLSNLELNGLIKNLGHMRYVRL